MTEALNPRVEWEIREAIDEISQGDWTISETANKLLRIGVTVRESGNEPKIEGPFGLPRPFAEISLSDRMTELRTETDDDLAERLTREFDNKPNTAAREAIRLGVLVVAGDQFKIRGSEGGPRPFAQVSLEGIDDNETHQLLEKLKERIK